MDSFEQAHDSVTPQVPSNDPDSVRTWAMLLHFSQLAGYALPIAGLLAPIIIWQVKKDEMPELDEHGKIVVNWIVTSLIYWMISIGLCLVIIGIPLIILMMIVSLAFPIIGGIKANNGEYWAYPGTFRIL